MFTTLAPVIGAGLALTGIGLLYVVVADRRKARLVSDLQTHGPRSLDKVAIGDTAWVQGDIVPTKVLDRPFGDGRCLAWRIHISHVVSRKVSNDGGYSESREELHFEARGGEVRLRNDAGVAALEIDECDYRLLECDSFSGADLPSGVAEWMTKRSLPLDGKELEVELFYVPIDAKVDMLGRVSRIEGNVRWLDDAGPTGLALSVQGLEGYVRNLKSGSVGFSVAGLVLVLAGLALAGAGLFR